MYPNLLDFIQSCPQQLEPNSIIVFDGCKRVLEQIAPGVTCDDVQGCIDLAYLLSLLNFSTGLLVNQGPNSISVNPDFVNSSIVSTLNCQTGILTIGLTNIDLNCIANKFVFTFQDGLHNYAVANHDLITVQGLDGLRFVAGANILQIGLPIGASLGQVLTWNGNNAYRANAAAIQCDQVQACMAQTILGLQNQINIIAGQGGTSSTTLAAQYVQITQGSNSSVAPGSAVSFLVDNPTGIYNTASITAAVGPGAQGTAFNLPVGTYMVDYECSSGAACSLALYQGATNSVLNVNNNTISGASTGTTWIHGKVVVSSSVGMSRVMLSPVTGTLAIPTAGTAAGMYIARITFTKIA